MAKRLLCGSSLLLFFAFFSALSFSALSSIPAAAVKDLWASTPPGVSCTMCASCDNPCHHLLPPPVPLPPPPPSRLPPPPPPSPPSSGAYYYYYHPPPPPSGGAGGEGGPGYSYPPPFTNYHGPPPPNPIMPYFPFYFYSPPPPNRATFISGSSLPAPPFASSLRLFCLFIPFLLFL